MKIEKIEILTSNKKHATDIAMLVDKYEFLQEIQKLRQKWKITKLYKRKGLVNNTGLFDEQNPLYFSDLTEEEATKKLPEFHKDIDNLLKVFNRGKNFRQVVLYALISGQIPESIYQSCYFDVVTINENEDLNKPENYQYVIVMSPRTEQQEMIDAFEVFRKHREGKVKFHKPKISPDSTVTKEFTEAIECIEKEKKIYEEQIKNNNSLEGINKAMANFFRKTEIARDYLLQIGELNIDTPDHKELIEDYHRGNIYNTVDPAKFQMLPKLNRTREWYWMAYSDKFNNNSVKKRKRSEDVLTEWQLLNCPVKMDHDDIVNEEKCPFCSIKAVNDVDQALSAYSRLLKQS